MAFSSTQEYNGNLDRMIFLFRNAVKVNVIWIPISKENFAFVNRVYGLFKVLLVRLFCDCKKIITVTIKIYLVSLLIFCIFVYGFKKQ